MNKQIENYYDGLNLKLLEAIPADAQKILELGCANGRLGRKYKEKHPTVYWSGVEISSEAAKQAAEYLDTVHVIDLDTDDLSVVGKGFDTIVIGDLLEHLRNPKSILEKIHHLSDAQARIVCCVPNMSHSSVVQRLLTGDISYDASGLLDETHLKFFSPSSLFKLLLDSGWLPNMIDHYSTGLPDTSFNRDLISAAQKLGVPPSITALNLSLYQMIVFASKWQKKSFNSANCRTSLSVVVPVTRPWQCDLNISRSPGLTEIGADVVYVQGAGNAAEAFVSGLGKTTAPWIIMAHQDVYFPSGTGHAILRELVAIEDEGFAGTPVGFAGIAKNRLGETSYSGWVIDRRNLFQHKGSNAAESMDEFAICLHRDSKISIDPNLGWHLWATDLCLQAESLANRPIGRILEIPLFHNSVNDYTLPDDYHRSADYLLKKYPQLNSIQTLCGLIERPAKVA